MSKDDTAVAALQYLLDEGFISLEMRKGEPTVCLQSVPEAQRAVKWIAKYDLADWWKK